MKQIVGKLNIDFVFITDVYIKRNEFKNRIYSYKSNTTLQQIVVC